MHVYITQLHAHIRSTFTSENSFRQSLWQARGEHGRLHLVAISHVIGLQV